VVIIKPVDGSPALAGLVDAVGGRVRVGDGIWMTVVGVCGDVIHDWFDRRNAPTLYRPLLHGAKRLHRVRVRTTSEPLALVGGVRRALAHVDPQQPIYDVMPMRQRCATGR